MRDAYGLRPLYLTARSAGGDLSGVLPLACFRSLRASRELISLPFLDGGGILASDAEAERALLEAALEQARRMSAAALELRQTQPLLTRPDAGGAARVDLVLRLQGDEAKQWQAIGSKVRNQTRKAEREGLVLAQGAPAELLRAFYSVYCTNMRDLGSPPHALSFFSAMAKAFGKELRVFAARREGRTAGALIAIAHSGRVFVPWASTLREERQRCPNNLIYWEAIRWALSLGAREFDFGRSAPDSGTYHFKRGWGAEEQPLAWTRLSAGGEPESAEQWTDHPLLQTLSRVWVRIPVGISTWLGSRLRPYLAN